MISMYGRYSARKPLSRHISKQFLKKRTDNCLSCFMNAIALGAVRLPCRPGRRPAGPDARPIMYRVVIDKLNELFPDLEEKERIAREIVYEFGEDYAAAQERQGDWE